MFCCLRGIYDFYTIEDALLLSLEGWVPEIFSSYTTQAHIYQSLMWQRCCDCPSASTPLSFCLAEAERQTAMTKALRHSRQPIPGHPKSKTRREPRASRYKWVSIVALRTKWITLWSWIILLESFNWFNIKLLLTSHNLMSACRSEPELFLVGIDFNPHIWLNQFYTAAGNVLNLPVNRLILTLETLVSLKHAFISFKTIVNHWHWLSTNCTNHKFIFPHSEHC